MIIIDAQATMRLYHVLKTIPDLEGYFCIYLKHTSPEQQERIRESRQFSNDNMLEHMQLFFCHDGSVFLLIRGASLRAARKILIRLADLIGMELNKHAAELIDMDADSSRLRTILAERINRHIEDKKNRAASQQAAQTMLRRKAILNGQAVLSEAANAARSKGRLVPEIMMIEDDAFSHRLVKNLLKKQYRLTWLATARDALQTYASLAPDIIFLDINLPDVTGHELLERIIAIDPAAHVVMLSGNADRLNVMQAMELGARGFVAKPFTKEKLFQHIARAQEKSTPPCMTEELSE